MRVRVATLCSLNFAAFQRLAVYRELLILNDFVFHSPKGGAEVGGAGERDGGQGEACWLPLLSSGKSVEQIHHVCLQLWAK